MSIWELVCETLENGEELNNLKENLKDLRDNNFHSDEPMSLEEINKNLQNFIVDSLLPKFQERREEITLEELQSSGENEILFNLLSFGEYKGLMMLTGQMSTLLRKEVLIDLSKKHSEYIPERFYYYDMSIIILERLIARIENAEKMEYNRCKDFSRQLNDVNKGKTFSEDFKSDLNKLRKVNGELKTSSNSKKS
tara:strand:- start:2578 stop:3162 length:585 start_codon:yes stop_codon:yes gene_type:complete